ncbi:MAG TPA: hypothetical protein VFC03_16335 [Acidimicrobiales bacterium]|nr:hypothetical protein [Acidimicrobiales bacterium]
MSTIRKQLLHQRDYTFNVVDILGIDMVDKVLVREHIQSHGPIGQGEGKAPPLSMAVQNRPACPGVLP